VVRVDGSTYSDTEVGFNWNNPQACRGHPDNFVTGCRYDERGGADHICKTDTIDQCRWDQCGQYSWAVNDMCSLHGDFDVFSAYDEFDRWFVDYENREGKPYCYQKTDETDGRCFSWGGKGANVGPRERVTMWKLVQA